MAFVSSAIRPLYRSSFASVHDSGSDLASTCHAAGAHHRSPRRHAAVHMNAGDNDVNASNAQPPPESPSSPPPFNDTLLRDAKRLRSRRERATQSMSDTLRDATTTDEGSDGGFSLRGAVDTLLIWDFFLVVALLVWLAVALVPHFAIHNDALLDPWLTLWKPFIQPVLGVLMLGTIAQGTLSFFSKD